MHVLGAPGTLGADGTLGTLGTLGTIGTFGTLGTLGTLGTIGTLGTLGTHMSHLPRLAHSWRTWHTWHAWHKWHTCPATAAITAITTAAITVVIIVIIVTAITTAAISAVKPGHQPNGQPNMAMLYRACDVPLQKEFAFVRTTQMYNAHDSLELKAHALHSIAEGSKFRSSHSRARRRARHTLTRSEEWERTAQNREAHIAQVKLKADYVAVARHPRRPPTPNPRQQGITKRPWEKLMREWCFLLKGLAREIGARTDTDDLHDVIHRLESRRLDRLHHWNGVVVYPRRGTPNSWTPRATWTDGDDEPMNVWVNVDDVVNDLNFNPVLGEPLRVPPLAFESKFPIAPLRERFSSHQKTDGTIQVSTEEDWHRRVAHRKEGVSAIKRSEEYRCAIMGLRLSKRARLWFACGSPMPTEPDTLDRTISKREWEKRMVSWRTALKLYWKTVCMLLAHFLSQQNP